MRVLVADDDPVIALGFASRLKRLGHVPLGPAHDGADAIEIARRELPDLYMFDITMPHVDGLSAAALLAEEGLRRPVVLITGVDDPELIERSVQSGVGALLTKPVDDLQLAAALMLAAARHSELCALEAQVDKAVQALEDRKVLERAKGLLMETFGLSEQRAFQRIQKSARDRNLTLAAVARQVIDQQALLKDTDHQL